MNFYNLGFFNSFYKFKANFNKKFIYLKFILNLFQLFLINQISKNKYFAFRSFLIEASDIQKWPFKILFLFT